MLLLLHLIHPSPNSSPPPPPAPLIPAPQTPQNPHLSQPLKYSTMKPHKTAAQMRASRAAVIRSRLQLYLLAAVACPGRLPEPSPGRSTGPEMALIFRL